MPGHRVKRSDVKNATLFEKYQCPQCHLLLRSAVQPLCGHWLCESCADNLLGSLSSPKCPRPDCQEDLKSDDADEGPEYFPDRFVRREIEGLVVSCPHRPNGCQWEGKLGNYEKHLMTCQFASQSCPDCGETVTMDKMQSHKQVCLKARVQCPLAGLGCQHTQTMTRDELEKHILTHGVKHLAVIGEVLKLLKLSPPNNVLPTKALVEIDESNATGQDIVCHSDAIEIDGVGIKSKGIRAVARDGPRVATDSSASYGLPDRNALEAQAASMVGFDRQITEKMMAALKSKDEEIATLRNDLTKLEKAMRSKHAEYEDKDFRLSLIENSNYDGSMIWKIPQFSQRMADAQSGRYTSIFSLPFYSGRYGYKMCLRLYILGDGIGKNTHMSLFFVIMKGEFDNILQWPFTHKVTFKLINQTGGRDIIDTFQPDPMSSSFRKPKSDMNIASGCPRFVSHTELKNGGFIIDDTVFIKCSIDCSSIKHP